MPVSSVVTPEQGVALGQFAAVCGDSSHVVYDREWNIRSVMLGPMAKIFSQPCMAGSDGLACFGGRDCLPSGLRAYG